MRGFVKVAAVLACVVLLPSAAFAQAGLAGNVKDTSGAVLPGVTVEAASPALIEKTRSVVTDGAGNYKIENLRPGTYTVTFTLPGFNTVKREGIELTGSFVATVNADMKVGAIEETITVTGETPLVDVQSTARQSVLSKDVIEAIPTGRSYYSLGVLLPGVNSNSRDIGGADGGGMASLTAHGSQGGDQRVLQNGLNVSTLQTGGGNISGMIPNQSGAQEVAIDTGAGSAERQTSGVAINFIQRDGGNTIRSYSFFTFANEDMVGDNLSDRLKFGPYGAPGVTNAAGLAAVNKLKENWEVNPSIGGPILKDRLWYYYAARYQKAQNYAAGMYQNLNAFDITKWTYVPDKSRQALSRDGWWDSSQIRVTWQMNAKNKFTGMWDQQAYCQCPNNISDTRAPEAANDRRFPTQQFLHGEWFSPLTSKILIEFVGLHRTERWGNMELRPESDGGSFDRYFPLSALTVYPQLIPVVEQNSVNGMPANLIYRGADNPQNNGAWNSNWVPSYHYRGAVSYITGTHSFKFGFNEAVGYILSDLYKSTPLPVRYRTRSPVDANGNITAADGLPTPNQVTVWATPYRTKSDQDHDLGLYAQDKWTLNRLTMNLGLRFDWFKSSFPTITIPASTIFLGTSSPRAVPQTLQGYDNLNWKDITPRFGASYDLRGDGKTALKFSANKYVAGTTANNLAGANPVSRLTNFASRTWTDSNRDMRVDCVLTNVAKNGECAAFTGDNVNFGTLNSGAGNQPSLIDGWNKRDYNWEFSAGVQRELRPRVSMEVSYFRRIFGNFRVTDNANITPAMLDRFDVIVPTDGRLGEVSGKTVSGFYDTKPEFASVATNNKTLLVKDLPGSPEQTSHWNGVDVSVNARLRNGLLLQGGTSTGRTSTNNCEVIAVVPESLGSTPAGYCDSQGRFRTQVKAIAVYTVPKIDVQIAGTFQSLPGDALQVAYTLDNTTNRVNSTLGRNFTGVSNRSFNLLEPTIPIDQERQNQLDMRIAKIFRYGRTRTNVSIDLYNVFNDDTVLSRSSAYETLWRPSSILQARFFRVSAQFDF